MPKRQEGLSPEEKELAAQQAADAAAERLRENARNPKNSLRLNTNALDTRRELNEQAQRRRFVTDNTPTPPERPRSAANFTGGSEDQWEQLKKAQIQQRANVTKLSTPPVRQPETEIEKERLRIAAQEEIQRKAEEKARIQNEINRRAGRPTTATTTRPTSAATTRSNELTLPPITLTTLERASTEPTPSTSEKKPTPPSYPRRKGS